MYAPILRAIALTCVVAAPAVAQADLIYYPFVTGTGTTVQNLATGGPKTGTLVNTNTTNSGWVAGKGGGYALSGHDATTTAAYVDSGLNSGTSTSLFTGSFTVAMFLKNRIQSANALSYFFSGIGSFRMFTGGVAYEGLYLRNWGGTPTDLVLRGTTNKQTGTPFFDFRSETQKGWVHIALVVDATNNVATWYVNGSPFDSVTLTAGANVTGTGNFLVGRHTSTSSASEYDMDDFRLSNRAASPHEIQAWAQAKLRADKTELSIAALDKQQLSLDSGTANATRLYWTFGSLTGTWPQTVLGTASIPLVIDPYTNLALGLTNSPVFANFRGVLDANGKAKASFNIPNGAPASAAGLTLYHAYLVYDASNNYYDVSNAVPLLLKN
ncbi:MAG: hypothetical protein H6837_03005 [Planctomycetes bacterium]|nr:hypothetical protein [Planctomycetota bacterium]